MNSLHYTDGYNAAKQGGWRVPPSNLKVVTQPWRDWYAGFDASVQDGKHPGLSSSFSAREGVKVTGKRVRT